MASLYIKRRFRGPSASANGGYTSGVIAALAPCPVTVRLLKPPPLDRALEVVDHGDGRLEVRADEVVLAQARPGAISELSPPACPSHADAAEAARRYAGWAHEHPAPECFVCGPERGAGDGLCIFPGPTHDARIVAAPWQPDASLDAGDGRVGLEFMWAALDCPGYHALTSELRPMLLGELTAETHRRVRIGEPCIVVGWKIAGEGRKHEAGTALFGSEGQLCGLARALWIEPRA